jgi:hypothetical protein
MARLLQDDDIGTPVTVDVPHGERPVPTILDVRLEATELPQRRGLFGQGDTQELLAPGQAGMYYYENSQIGMEREWELLREAGRSVAGKTRTAALEPDALLGALGGASLAPLAEALKGYVDFALLPEFSAVKKYFGCAMGHVRATGEGLYAESVDRSPPPSGP